MSLKDLDKFYREIQTLDVHLEYFEDKPPIMVTSHFNPETTIYHDKLIKLRELSLSSILMLSPQQIQFNVNRLQLINERLERLWAVFSSHVSRLKRRDFPAAYLVNVIREYITVKLAPQDVNSASVPNEEEFIREIESALIIREKSVQYLLFQLNNITAIKPILTTSNEERLRMCLGIIFCHSYDSL